MGRPLRKTYRRRSALSRFKRRPKMYMSSKAPFVSTLAKGRYMGRSQKTYQEYVWEETDDVLLSNIAYSTPDQVQAFIWSVTDLRHQCSLDGLLSNLVTSHESCRLAYAGIEIKPQANVAGFSNGIQIGDVAIVPTVTTSAFTYFGKAAQSALFVPATLTALCEGVENSTKLNIDFSATKTYRKFQPGCTWNQNMLEGGKMNGDPQWSYDVAPFPWKPTVTVSSSAPGHAQEIGIYEVWAPGIVFANWLTGTTTPIRFTVRTVYKWQFKGKRLVTGGNSAGVVRPPSGSKHHVRSVGLEVKHYPRADQVLSEVVEEEWCEEEEEKKSDASISSKAPAVSRAASNTGAGLARQLTNVNLGASPQPPQMTPSKRFFAAPSMGTSSSMQQ